VAHAARETEVDAMTDTPPTKRRLWQIHLSTAVAATLLAGGFIHINSRVLYYDTREWVDHDGRMCSEQYEAMGWPCFLAKRKVGFTVNYKFYGIWESHWTVSQSDCVWNAFVALSFVGIVITASEYLLRRRSKP
jgi:hypothetical protein